MQSLQMDYITYFPHVQVERKKNIVFDRKKHISLLTAVIWNHFRKKEPNKENRVFRVRSKAFFLTFPAAYPRIPKICVWIFIGK